MPNLQLSTKSSQHQSFMVTTVGAIRVLGLNVIQTDDKGHCSITFDAKPTMQQLGAFKGTFGQTIKKEELNGYH
jgi:hypothetical protein